MSKRGVKRRQPKPWPLAKVYAECRAAPVVWLALWDMATERGAPLVFPTREGLAKDTGITRLPTITAALKALADAHWIDRIHVRVPRAGSGIATCLRVILRYGAQKTFAITSRRMANDIRSHSSAQKSFADSSYGRGGVPKRRRPPADAGASTGRPKTHAPKKTAEEHSAVRTERERAAATRARREARKRKQDEEAESESDTEAAQSVA